MIKNYFKIAWRNITRYKAFSAINIIGLSIGMACSIFILLWVQNERSYDTFHENADNIYRVTANVSDFHIAVSPSPIGPAVTTLFPQVKSFVRLNGPASHVFSLDNHQFEEKNTFYVDSNFLSFFSFPLLKGDAATALLQPDAIVITETIAKKYFGNNDPIGNTVKMDNLGNRIVTGVLKNVPANSHLQFDCLMPMSAIAQTNRDLRDERWDNFNFYTYLLFDKSNKGDRIAGITNQLNELYKTRESSLNVLFAFEPLKDIHLHSNLEADFPGRGNAQYVKIFFVIAIFILLVACINFMNLATARSARRAKEVGLRKVVGATRRQLVFQLMGESILFASLSLIVAILLVWLLLPLFNQLAGKEITIDLFSGNVLLSLLLIVIVTGIVAGSYPALFLSGFQPSAILKGSLKSKGGNLVFRNSLVVLQFVIAIALLAGTIIVYQQLSYIRHMNLGFDKANVLYIPMKGELWNKTGALKAELAQNPLTSDFAFAGNLPVSLTTGTINVDWDGKDPQSQVLFPNMGADENLLKVLDLKIAAGRYFSKEFKGDSANYVINEKAAMTMGFSSPADAVGKTFTLWGTRGQIVGIVKDFNFKPVQHAIEPLVFFYNSPARMIVVRTQPGKTDATINALEKISLSLNPSFPFSFGFLDDELNKQYRGEQQMGSLFNVFAIIAILISCIGLYGLSAFMAEMRIKEIGIRKALGASVSSIVYLLSSGFARLLLIATLIAIPLAWYVLHSWLEGFVYRIDIGWIVFAAAAFTALIIAGLTISYESIKAARAAPVKSLRSE